jgi:hypothetical protein
VELTSRYSPWVDRTAHGSHWRDLARRVPMVRVARASAACRVVGRNMHCGLGANAGVRHSSRIPSALLRISLCHSHYCDRNSFTLRSGGRGYGLAAAANCTRTSSHCLITEIPNALRGTPARRFRHGRGILACGGYAGKRTCISQDTLWRNRRAVAFSAMPLRS